MVLLIWQAQRRGDGCATFEQAFQLREMASSVAATPLTELIAVLLTRLLDTRVPLLPDGAQLLKALNVLMLKMLDHSNRCTPILLTTKLATSKSAGFSISLNACASSACKRKLLMSYRGPFVCSRAT